MGMPDMVWACLTTLPCMHVCVEISPSPPLSPGRSTLVMIMVSGLYGACVGLECLLRGANEQAAGGGGSGEGRGAEGQREAAGGAAGGRETKVYAVGGRG